MFVCGDYQDANRSAFDIGGVACGIGFNPSTPSSYWVKLFNTHFMYEWRQVHNGETIQFPWGPQLITQDSFRPIANSLGHEIGHVIGLAHTFNGANGCADAAAPNRGDGWNNQMDYTGATGTALTPCQLGMVNSQLYNPTNPDRSFRNYLSNSYCGEVPPRAFFVMASSPTPAQVLMGSRGTFMADNMTISVYEYDPTSPTGRGAFLADYYTKASKGGMWNLANVYSFANSHRYYIQLVARRNSGQVHSRGQLVDIN